MPRRRQTASTLRSAARSSAGTTGATGAVTFEPRYPTLIATLTFSLWIALLSIPMLTGAFLASPYNDQYSSGYAYRHWAAEWTKTLGHIPLWNPEIFGGIPFVAGMHGDVLYPTAWLRLVLPTHVAMNLGFVVHYILAGLFTYLFLRRWRVSWTGAVVGGLAYQMAGVIGSYVSPGHDGKLFVTAMLPLAVLALTLGIRDRRLEGFAILAVAVGLMMLSPHPQMAQYALLAAGIFALYLVFSEGSVKSMKERVTALGLAVAGVVVGVGISAAQYLPFYEYIPYSPRDASVLKDFAWSAAYAIPWAHVPEFVIPRFTGETFTGTYWGPNGLKLHSEYLGLLAVVLAAFGAADRDRRRMVVWLGAIALLFLLVALGGATPFYRLWWEVVPFASSMRAPGMALFVVAFVVSVLAAFGVERVAAGRTSRLGPAAMIAGGAVAVLGVSGLLGSIAQSLGTAIGQSFGFPQWAERAAAAAQTIQWSALVAGLAAVGAGAATVALRRGRLPGGAWAAVLIALVGTDLWLNVRPFWMYSNVHEELFAGDAIKARLKSLPKPIRVWDVQYGGIPSVYEGAALMADDIAQLYGHHGNEPHAFDVLNARQGSSLSFARAGDPRILDLFAVNHVILQAQAAPDSLPGFRRTLSDVAASSGATATLFERERPVPYARFVPTAIPAASMTQAASTVVGASFDPYRVVMLDSTAGAPAGAMPDSLPPAPDLAITFAEWRPGRMRMQLGAPAPSAGHVLVSENWDQEWRATVDGRETPVQRGNVSLITVPVPAGAREIVLDYEGRAFARGRTISLVSLLVVAIGLIAPVLIRRRSGARGLTTSSGTPPVSDEQ
jgi:hypothetical protein